MCNELDIWFDIKLRPLTKSRQTDHFQLDLQQKNQHQLTGSVKLRTSQGMKSNFTSCEAKNGC